MEIVLQILCSFLMAAGLLFILLDIRTKFDRSFGYFGAALIMLSLMAAIDIWISPGHGSLEHKLFWERMLHVIAGFFTISSISYHLIMTKWKSQLPLKIMVAFNVVCLPLLFSNWMLGIHEGKVEGGPLYYVLFFPLALYYVACVNYVLIAALRHAIGDERKIIWFHLAGFIVLGVSGIADMTGIVNPNTRIIPSFKIIGIFTMGVMYVMVFTERFLQLLRDRNVAQEKLQSAYSDLQQSQSLRQLGESTAIINHEIKNYMFMISGNAQLIHDMDLVTGKGKELLGHIISSVTRLQNFSQDILELSKTHILRDKKPLNLPALIRDVIKDNFSEKREHFQLHGCERDYEVPGDWDKLHQVFTNLFGNAFDAAHPGEELEIKVRVSATTSVILVTVEDNGIGCNQEQLKNMFRAFFTTKIGSKGTGLGLSISRTIIESHGGHISLYSKNLAEDGHHGVKFQITFPNFSEDLAKDFDRKSPIMVIKEGLPDIAGIIRVFQNVYVTPYFVQNVNELLQQNFQRKALSVIASGETIKMHFAKLKDSFSKVCLLSEQKGSLYVYDFGGNKTPMDFSEEYVLQNLVTGNSAAQRIKENAVPEIAV